MSRQQSTIPSKPLANWLFFVASMVLAMAVIGAITRLTESGLSMVEWRPLIGTLPPLSAEEWQRVFDLYRETPEYQKKNFGLTLDEFKQIFFWEWFHRLWGRLIGLAYALPLLYFWITKKIPDGYKSKLLLGLFLGGAQAVMGWYMVESGLVDRPDVSHYRLAAHLSLAFVIFAYILWLAFDMKGNKAGNATFCLKRHAWITLGTTAVTIVWGAYVAGLNAGLVYNTWPKMGPHWIPPELNSFFSIFEDPVSVQFTHRWLAIIAFAVILSFAYRIKSFALALIAFVQVGLGIATLLMNVPITLAALHQLNAFLLIGVLIFHMHALRRG
ncbi:MAG: COX15/CtaA family protein [Pseudomonadota bacterium]